jgi:methionyl-tRNA formyltransferase
MRVVFLGNAAWSVPSVEALAGSSHPLVSVVTRAPRPAGRGGTLTPTPVSEAARRLRLPLQEVETVKSGPGFEALAGSKPDVLVVVAYGEILPKAVLAIPRVAPVNLHFSLLPQLRGAAPVQKAILDGLAVTGVTTIRMDEGMDTGPMLLQAEEPIGPDDDAGLLGARLATLGARVLVESLDRLEAGTVEERPQDESRATYAPKLRPADEFIDWNQPSEQIERRIRALSPIPGARASFRGKVMKVHRASGNVWGSLPPGESGSWPPGRIFVADDGGFGVMTGEGPLKLEEVALEGRRRMSGAEFVRGHRPGVGETLG